MGFLKINWRKSLFMLFLCTVLFGSFAGLGYLHMHGTMSKAELNENTHSMLFFFSGLAILWVLLHFLAGWYRFLFARKQLSYISTLNLFDGGKYVNGYTLQDSWFRFTKEALYGRISGYPVGVYVNYPYARSSRPAIIANFFVVRLNENSNDQVRFQLDRRGVGDKDIKQEINARVSSLISKGLPPQPGFPQD